MSEELSAPSSHPLARIVFPHTKAHVRQHLPLSYGFLCLSTPITQTFRLLLIPLLLPGRALPEFESKTSPFYLPLPPPLGSGSNVITSKKPSAIPHI